ncbi:restriction endonuclease [Macrococcoides goetzii]|uniref:Restriction endonuclease n=2 Tax=Macrococcoides goetzii TaxID=1891097 RepID=A0A364JMA3_9STAP|nr:restriction endonuclease [Macrococcus goetzii]
MINISKFEYESASELIMYAKEAEGKYLYEIDKKDIFDKPNKKGLVGTIIEESYFGIETNNRPEPDFADVGIELKSTGIEPYKKQNGYRAKERLVLNIINYNDEAKRDFYSSSFWLKNNKILLFFYTYVRNEDGKPDYPNFIIKKTILHEFSESDLIMIKKDWEIINNKIKAGLAHELSEKDTDYLAACTKGKNASSLKEQPFSDIMAKQRAYSLKQGYMTSLVKKYIEHVDMPSFASKNELVNYSIPELINKSMQPYMGLSTEEIASKLGTTLSKAKHKNQILVSEIFGVKKTSLNDIEEFSKANIKFKTIVINSVGTPTESISFENLDFDEIYNVEWENSTLRDNFVSIKWLFIIFEKNSNGKHYLKGTKLWTVPEEILDSEIKGLYNYLKKQMKNNNLTDHLPSSVKFNGVCHVRPKGQNREKSLIKLPNDEVIPHQCFWFNSGYIKNIILI